MKCWKKNIAPEAGISGLKSSLRNLSYRLLPLLLLSVLLPAQSDSGFVRGTVTDQEGAAISGGTVVLTNLDTNRAQTTTTQANGLFDFGAVPRGHYRIEIHQKGFKSDSAEFSLDVSQARQTNFQLQVGTVNEVVDVTSVVPLVDTATSALGEVIEGRQITELPLNGRNFTQLATLTPGVTRGDYGNIASGVNNNAETFRNSDSGGASLSVNGLRQQSNNFILDGADNNESLVNTIVFFPPAEAIQEFRVDTSVAPAEFGRAGGAIVETSIKSGTNSIHGSAFEFLRNSAFDANPNYFASPPLNKALPFKRNQFGGTLGGPILKNKLFLFVDYQGLRQDQPLNPEFATVPTALMRQGNFSELLGSGLTTVPDPKISGCVSVTAVNGGIYDPRTCAQFPGNIIPTNVANPAGLKYLNAFPLPNIPGKILQNFEAIRTNIRNFNDFDARVDYNLSPKDLMFARFSYAQDNFTLTPRLGVLPSGFGSGNNFADPRGGVFGYTRTFSSTVLNEFRFGYTRDNYGFEPPFQGVPLSANFGIVNANRSPLLGGGALIGGFNNELEFTGDGGPFLVPQPTLQFEDSVSYNHGAHSFRFGANIIRREVDFFQGNDAKGFFQIGPGTGQFTGYEVSELLAGFIQNYSLGSLQGSLHTLGYETGYFAQDDWRFNKRLTLNLGLRYDLYTPPYETNNQQSNFDLQTGTLLLPGQGGLGRSLVKTDHDNFAPRIGFAYDLLGQGKTILRGGYGIFYFLDRGGVGNQLGNNPDFNGVSTISSNNGFRVTFTGQGPLNNNDFTLATNPLPAPSNNVNPANPQNVSVISLLPNNETSAVQQYNLQIEQQLDRNTALDVAYVGSKEDHLMTYFNFNSTPLNAAATNAIAFPNLGGVTVGAAGGVGSYNGLQLRLNRRLVNGFQFTTSYTWSHSIDDSNGAFSTTCGGACGRIFVQPGTGALLNLNRGSSDQDERQVFVFSTLYEIPFGKGKQFGQNAPSVVQAILGNWQLANIVSWGSGTPFDLTVNGTPQNRPDLVGPVVLNGPNKQYINLSAFAAPPVNGAGVFTRPGTLGRNVFAGPGYGTADLSLIKRFNITERVKTEMRAEAFNLLNTPQFTNPDGNISDGAGNFGVIKGTRQDSERELQFVLRFTF